MTDIISATTTLLDTALTCFERVQIARSFDQDLDSHRIKLDIIQLRLSRWGEAVGLYSSSDSDSGSNSTALTTNTGGGEGAANGQLTTPLLTPANHEAAQDLLKAITHQFARAQKKAASMQPQPQQDDSIDPANDLSSLTLTLRTKLRAALGRRRAQLVKATHSVQWAFYKKQQFDSFVADLSDNIRQLEELFPSEEEATKRLCELGASDCAGINKVYLRELGDVTEEEGCDPYLNAAVVEALKSRAVAEAGTTINMSNKGHNYGQQIGQMSGTQKGFTFGTTNNFRKGATNYSGVGAN